MGEPTAGSQRLLSTINSRAVLELIDARGALARPDLVAAVGLSKTAVGRILTDLQARGIVERTGTDTNRRGPAAAVFGLNPRFRLCGALDVGHRTISAAIVDMTGALLNRQEDSPASPQDRAQLARTLLARTAEQTGTTVARLDRIIVGCAEPGEAAQPGGAPLSGETPLPGAFADQLSAALPGADLAPATHLAATAEARAVADSGSGQPATFALLRLGGTFGVGIVCGGQVLPGAHGQAGLRWWGPPLGSAQVAAEARAAGLGALSAHEIFTRARAGDAAALAVVDSTGRSLAPVAASVVSLFDPEFLVLGGGIGANADLLIPPLRSALAETAPGLTTPIVGTRAGTDPVLAGAAILGSAQMRARAFEDVAREPRTTV